MNATNSVQGPTGPRWLSKIEQHVNRLADAMLDGFECLANDLEKSWKSIARRFRRTHA